MQDYDFQVLNDVAIVDLVTEQSDNSDEEGNDDSCDQQNNFPL